MAMKGHRPGGGIASNKITERPVRAGSGSHSTRAAGAAQIGLMWGNKVTHMKGTTDYTGEKLHNPDRNFQPTPFGNEVAAKTVCEPGGSRTVMKSGSQGMTGAPAPGNPPAQGKDILNEFGPNKRSY